MIPDLLSSTQAPLESFWSMPDQAGVDEVGIGPLAGPVVAAAVILDADRPIEGLNDSKKLSAKRRAKLAREIRVNALAWGIGAANVSEIDERNILRASHLAMQRAIQKLGVEPALVLVDGNKTPSLGVPAVAVVKGDGKVPQISAASILAKVCRDRIMQRLDRRYPDYGFGKNMGYPTRAHMEALRLHGPIAEHRRSFAPVRQAAAENTSQQNELL